MLFTTSISSSPANYPVAPTTIKSPSSSPTASPPGILPSPKRSTASPKGKISAGNCRFFLRENNRREKPKQEGNRGGGESCRLIPGAGRSSGSRVGVLEPTYPGMALG